MTATALIALSIVPAAAAISLFTDDFNDGTADGWVFTGAGSWSVIGDPADPTNKVLTQSKTGNNETYATAGDSGWTNYAVSARVSLFDGEGYPGLLARFSDTDNYYMCRVNKVSEARAEFSSKLAGTSTVITSLPLATTTGSWYTLRMTVQGGTIRCYVDGRTVGAVTDASLGSGKIGIRTNWGAVGIDDVQVDELPATLPDAPSAPVLAGTPTETTVPLSWTAVDGTSTYRLYRSTSSTGPWTNVYAGADTRFTDSNLSAGSTYYYALSTDQGELESALSTPLEVTTALNAPMTPIGPQVSRATSTGVELVWSPADSRAAGYRLYRSEIDSTKPKLIYDGSDPNARDGSVEKGVTYRYSVSAYNRTGESSRSDPVTVTVPRTADDTIMNGLLWYDTSNKVIQAHGGSIIKVGKTYYWFGEDKAHNGASFRNVAIYASTDLTHWTFRNNALTPQSSPELTDAKIERPKIIYNNRTKQYVLWGHKELAGDYNQARVAVATSPTVDGDYSYRGSFRPDPDGDGIGDESRDYTIFKDDDGTAYLISSTNGNLDLGVYRLTPDYLNVSARIATLFPGQRREAPAVMRRDGIYYLFTSGQSGWAPNQGMYATATSMAGPWSTLKPFGDNWTYATQPAFIYPVQGTDTTSYLYVGDRWRPNRLGASEYIWLPLRFTADGSPVLDYTDRLKVDPKSGTVSTPQISRIDSDAVPSASSNSSGHEPAAGHDGNNATYWEAASKTLPAWYQLNLGSSQRVGRIDLNWRGIQGSEAFYQYTISASADGSTWTTIADRSTNIDLGFTSDTVTTGTPYRYLRVQINNYRNFTNNNLPGYNPGLNEMRVFGTPAS